MTKVILINGPARSGKDTLAGFLSKGRFTSDKSPFHFPYLTCEYKFAGVMQSLWRGIFAEITEEDEFHQWVDGDKKNEVHPFLGRSFRQAMISFSEDYMKAHYGANFFGRITAQEIENNQKFYNSELVAVISDSGFKEEAVSIIEKFGAENVLLVKLYRPGFTFAGDSRTYIDLEEFGVKTVELNNIDLDRFREEGIRLVSDFIEG